VVVKILDRIDESGIFGGVWHFGCSERRVRPAAGTQKSPRPVVAHQNAAADQKSRPMGIAFASTACGLSVTSIYAVAALSLVQL
jgi:hypothetical protein